MRCDNCNKMVQQTEAIGLNGAWYCSVECFKRALSRLHSPSHIERAVLEDATVKEPANAD